MQQNTRYEFNLNKTMISAINVIKKIFERNVNGCAHVCSFYFSSFSVICKQEKFLKIDIEKQIYRWFAVK